MNRPFYIARFLIKIGNLTIFCPFAGAHARGHSLFIRLQGRIVQGGTHLWHFSNSAAKKAFDAYKKENGSDKKLPRISELNAEYAMFLERKKSSYAEYRKTKSEMCKIMYIASVTLCVDDI